MTATTERPPPPKEQEISIPAGPVLTGVALVTVASVVIAVGASQLAQDPRAMATATGLGALGAGLATGLSALFFVSATPRPASICGSMWLAATLVRFVAVPAVCLSIYWSARSVGIAPVLATVGTYLGCLAVETAVVVRIVLRSPPETPR
jgi:hypothetical protein